MQTIKSKQLSQKFDVILCDSMDALQFCYKKPSKNIKSTISLAYILLNKNIKSENLYKKWTKEKLIDYQKTFYLSPNLFSKKLANLPNMKLN